MRYSLLFLCLSAQYIISGELFLHKAMTEDAMTCIIREIISSYDNCYSMPCSRIMQKNNNPIEYEWGRYPWGESGRREVIIPKKIRPLRMCLKAIRLTNKSLFDYFSQEKIQKNIIDYALKNNLFSNEASCAESLGYPNVLKKINSFHKKACSSIEFSNKELEKEAWYLKSHVMGQINVNTTIINRPINIIVRPINAANLGKIKTLWPYVSHVQVELDWYFYIALSSLGQSKLKRSAEYAEKLYGVVEFFLNCGADPDFKPTQADSFSDQNHLIGYENGAQFVALLEKYRKKRLSEKLNFYGSIINCQY